MKRQPTEWKKIFANGAANKGPISQIYNYHTQLNKKKNEQPKQKMGRRTKQTVLQRRHTDAH